MAEPAVVEAGEEELQVEAAELGEAELGAQAEAAPSGTEPLCPGEAAGTGPRRIAG